MSFTPLIEAKFVHHVCTPLWVSIIQCISRIPTTVETVKELKEHLIEHLPCTLTESIEGAHIFNRENLEMVQIRVYDKAERHATFDIIPESDYTLRAAPDCHLTHLNVVEIDTKLITPIAQQTLWSVRHEVQEAVKLLRGNTPDYPDIARSLFSDLSNAILLGNSTQAVCTETVREIFGDAEADLFTALMEVLNKCDQITTSNVPKDVSWNS